MGSTQDHTARFGPSFLGADPWTLAGDNLLSLSLELLKQSTPASI